MLPEFEWGKEKSAFRSGLGGKNDKKSFLPGFGWGERFKKRAFPNLGGGRLKKEISF